MLIREEIIKYSVEDIENENDPELDEIKKEYDGKLLPLKWDYVFKRVFGSEENKDILRAFIKDATNLKDDELGEITLLNTFRNKRYKDDKVTIFDVKITTKYGTSIVVEIQRNSSVAFPARMLYYTCGLISDQLITGNEYSKIERAISIVITDFPLFPKQGYHGWYRLREEKSKTLFTDLFEIHVLELPKVDLNCNDRLSDWMRAIRSEDRKELEMAAQKNEDIKKVVDVVEEMSSDEYERKVAFYEEKQRRDLHAREAYVRNEGIEKGSEQTTLSLAKKFKKSGVDISIIMENTGLSKEEIEKL